MRKPSASELLGWACLVIVAGLMVFIALGRTEKWVGRTDLEVRFVVTDSETGKPIPDATICIRGEPGGLCDAPPQPEFTIRTDDHGSATQLVTNCMCYGSKGTFEDTFASRLPPWWFHATANGFVASEPTHLPKPEYTRQVQRGDRVATLAVPIRLRR